MSKFWSSMAKRAQPYTPGLQVNEPNIIKLNTNENPYPPSPKVLQAIKEKTGDSLKLYSSPTADDLRASIADVYDLKSDQVFVGNGSDEVLAFSFMAFFEPGETIKYPNITYSFYPAYAAVFDIPYEEVPINEDFTLPVEQFFNAEGGVIFPNPNAPTSLYLGLNHIKEIVENNPNKVVIIDEAYIDFAEESAVSLIDTYDNLLVVQTTSKSRSLAGLRIGLALGNKSLIKALNRMKDSFNSYTLDLLALAGATAAFKDIDYFNEVTKKIITTRENTVKRMEQLGFTVLQSQTNFIFATHEDYQALSLYDGLRNEGILTRHFNQATIDNYLRVTIGTDEDMEHFFKKLMKLMDIAD